MLPFVVTPLPGESLHGFERRLCNANFLPNLRQWRGSAGIRGITPTSNNNHLWERLSEVSGQSIQSLNTMRWLPEQSKSLRGLVKFNGQLVQKKFLRTGRLRICPDCVSQSDKVLDAWALYYAVACPVHHKTLVDRCDNCDDGTGKGRHLQIISAAHPWECKCGRNFGDIEAPSASTAITGAMAALFQKLDGNDARQGQSPTLCAPFVSLSTNDLMTVIDILSIAVSTPEAKDENIGSTGVRYRHGSIDPTLTLEECFTRVESASAIMVNWPDAYFELLDRVAFRNKFAKDDIPERKAFATNVGQMLLFPRRSMNGEPLQVLQEAIDRYCLDRLKIKRRIRNLATSLPIANLLPQTASIDAVAKTLKGTASRARVRIAYELMLRRLSLDTSIGNPDELAVRLIQGVEAYLSSCENSISSVGAARLLEGAATDRRLTGWNHPDLLQPDVELNHFFGKRIESYRLKDVTNIKAIFDSLVLDCETTDVLITVRDALRSLLIFNYKKQQMLLDIKHGQISIFSKSLDSKFLDLMIDPRKANERIIDWLKASCHKKPMFITLRQARLLFKRAGKDFQQLTPSNLASLRLAGELAFEVNSIFDGKRFHPTYRYRLSEILAL